MHELRQDTPYRKKKFSITKTIGLITLISAMLFGIVEGIIIGVREYDKYTAIKKEVAILKKDNTSKDKLITTLQTKVDLLDEFINKKKTSYAVGFRVLIDENEEHIPIYKDWEGVTHHIYKDIQATYSFGVDSYFYVDSEGTKTFVW